jgi:hypothetical protein
VHTDSFEAEKEQDTNQAMQYSMPVTIFIAYRLHTASTSLLYRRECTQGIHVQDTHKGPTTTWTILGSQEAVAKSCQNTALVLQQRLQGYNYTSTQASEDTWLEQYTHNHSWQMYTRRKSKTCVQPLPTIYQALVCCGYMLMAGINTR